MGLFKQSGGFSRSLANKHRDMFDIYTYIYIYLALGGFLVKELEIVIF